MGRCNTNRRARFRNLRRSGVPHDLIKPLAPQRYKEAQVESLWCRLPSVERARHQCLDVSCGDRHLQSSCAELSREPQVKSVRAFLDRSPISLTHWRKSFQGFGAVTEYSDFQTSVQ